MKYLNKVVFINSADKSLKYAEVNLDGNVLMQIKILCGKKARECPLYLDIKCIPFQIDFA